MHGRNPSGTEPVGALIPSSQAPSDSPLFPSHILRALLLILRSLVPVVWLASQRENKWPLGRALHRWSIPDANACETSGRPGEYRVWVYQLHGRLRFQESFNTPIAGVAFFVLLWGLPGGMAAWGAAPTYHRDVAPILQKHCQDCHRPGQVAPFSLLIYEQARKRAADVAGLTTDHRMPPWPASTTEGDPFRDARVLSDAQIATLLAWNEAGCPEGDPP